jgi:hypothetical protein
MPVQSKILLVDSVKLSFNKELPPELIIEANGTSSTPQWTNAALSCYEYASAPQDGIQEFDLVAIPPSVFVPEFLSPIRTSYTVKAVPEWLRGVRVYSATNHVEKSRP